MIYERFIQGKKFNTNSSVVMDVFYETNEPLWKVRWEKWWSKTKQWITQLK